jgi:hypothetical protein
MQKREGRINKGSGAGISFRRERSSSSREVAASRLAADLGRPRITHVRRRARTGRCWIARRVAARGRGFGKLRAAAQLDQSERERGSEGEEGLKPEGDEEKGSRVGRGIYTGIAGHARLPYHYGLDL